MINFFIKSITASGKGKTTSTVDFIDGVNIIKGESDTGKTKVISSILFAMGANQKPFAEKTGYDTVVLTIGTPGGDITFTRKYSSNLIDVISANTDIESATYSTRYNTDRTPINDVWLHLIGIEEQPMLASNARSVKKRMTWNNLMRIFSIDEQEICRESSIIEPTQYVERTLLLSALLYLIYGKDFAGEQVRIDSAVREAKKIIMQEYLNKRMKSTDDHMDGLKEYAEKYPDDALQKELQATSDSLKDIEDQIGKALEDSQKIVDQIMGVEQKLGEMRLLANRYDSLSTQYRSDIRRYSFAADGAELIAGQEPVKNCPYCDHVLEPKRIPSYRKVSEAEVKRLQHQIEALSETQKGVEEDKLALEKELARLKEKYEQIEKLINEELNPRKTEIEKLLVDYQEQIDKRNQYKIYEDIKEGFKKDLEEYLTEEPEQPKEYKPKEYFDADFVKIMDIMAKEILTETKYPNFIAAHFDLKIFDLVINGGTKYDDHGKGYCAYINSVVTMMFRKYLAEHGTYTPGITIIDSPLHGMFQDVEDDAPESVKTGLFTYFSCKAGDGQLIIAENDEHVPELDFERLGVKVHEFSKTDPSKRHGFLLDVYQ